MFIFVDFLDAIVVAVVVVVVVVVVGAGVEQRALERLGNARL